LRRNWFGRVEARRTDDPSGGLEAEAERAIGASQQGGEGLLRKWGAKVVPTFEISGPTCGSGSERVSEMAADWK